MKNEKHILIIIHPDIYIPSGWFEAASSLHSEEQYLPAIHKVNNDEEMSHCCQTNVLCLKMCAIDIGIISPIRPNDKLDTAFILRRSTNNERHQFEPVAVYKRFCRHLDSSNRTEAKERTRQQHHESIVNKRYSHNKVPIL